MILFSHNETDFLNLKPEQEIFHHRVHRADPPRRTRRTRNFLGKEKRYKERNFSGKEIREKI
jgi:hypothetical protein